MKISIVAVLAVLFMVNNSMFAQSKNKNKKKQQPVEAINPLITFNDTVNYVLGLSMYKNFTTNDIEVNSKAFIQGFTDAQKSVDTLFTEEQLETIMRKFQMQMQEKMMEAQNKKLMDTKNTGAAFLEANKTKNGVIVTESGLQYQVIKEGIGKSPSVTDEVTVHYEGSLIDGTIFDSSYEREDPITFTPNRVIEGWQEGIQLMKAGAVYIFYIPSDLAYGDRDQGPIPGGSVLVFKVELISFSKGTDE